MATHTSRAVYESVAVPAANLSGTRVAWGGVWSGFLIGIGVFLILSTLGLAIGISAADVGSGDGLGAEELGTGALLWSGLTLLVSLFVGGMVATRSSMVFDKAAGVFEGVLVWVLSIVAIIYMASTGIGMLASGAFGLFGGVTQGVATAAGSIDMAGLARGDPDQILQRLDDPGTVKMVAAATGTPEAEARSTIAEIRQQVEASRDDPRQAAAAARQGLQKVASKAADRVQSAAATAQPQATRTAWMALGAMLLALLASIGGAMLGRRQSADRLVRASSAVTTAPRTATAAAADRAAGS